MKKKSGKQNSMPFTPFRRDHLRSSWGIICGSGSFAVYFEDHFRSQDHLRSVIICSAVQAPSTLIRFQTKTELFCSAYGYRPHYNAENDRRKRSHSKTLSSVDGENDAI